MSAEQRLTTLHQQLASHRAALQELWEEKATHERAIADIKAALQARGMHCDDTPYDGPGYPTPEPVLPDEARQCVERALRGTWRR